MPKTKAILAGASGFLGRTLQERLGGHYEFFKLPRPYPSEVPHADVLFHVAGVTKGRTSTAANDVCEINLDITKAIIELAHHTGIPRIVFAGSYVYGTPTSLPIAETHERQALSSYMKSKILSEDLLSDAVRSGAIKTVVSLRLFNVYGPGQQKGLLIPDILEQLAKGQIHLGDDRPARDFVHSYDVADAFHAATTANLAPFEAINIASGSSTRVAQVVDIICQTQAKSVPVHYNRSDRPIDIPDVVADIRKAKRLLSWQPQISLEAGLKMLVSHCIPA